jgi:redox-sensitive bicupin YhaK (pirin superfamily)
MKKVLGVYSTPQSHWVGDGFPVRSLFSYHEQGVEASPFLLLDYAGPTEFSPTEQRRGVGQHPHRGFETVTIVYKGGVAHRDSTGQGGEIGPGDVQWMTAGAGILHEEYHADAYARSGGEFEMVQLWVNLPARDKATPPGYQAIVSADIPLVTLPDDAGTLRVIAGEYDGHAGPAHTFSPMQVWDMQLQPGKSVELPLTDGWHAMLIVMHGTVRVNGGEIAGEAQRVQLDSRGSSVRIGAETDATLLLLSGEPINEPIVGYGPFVMNSQAEIAQAIRDFNSGQFGQIPR